jgi:transcriptional regulator with XRE-family HTH domain
MTSKERPADRGRRRGTYLLDELLREIRECRTARNLSQTSVAEALGISDSTLSRIERGELPSVSFVTIASLLSVLGLELSARAYPTGHGIRDRAQLVLLERLRTRVSPELTWRTEVPLPIQGDLRAWDAALIAPGLTIGIDAETRLRDVQAVDRRVMLKLRDSGWDRAILLVAATRTNRLVLGEFGPALRANFPIPGRSTLGALANGTDPGGNSVVLL